MRSLYGRKIYDAVPGKLEYGTPYIFWQLLEAVLTARCQFLLERIAIYFTYL